MTSVSRSSSVGPYRSSTSTTCTEPSPGLQRGLLRSAPTRCGARDRARRRTGGDLDGLDGVDLVDHLALGGRYQDGSTRFEIADVTERRAEPGTTSHHNRVAGLAGGGSTGHVPGAGLGLRGRSPFNHDLLEADIPDFDDGNRRTELRRLGRRRDTGQPTRLVGRPNHRCPVRLEQLALMASLEKRFEQVDRQRQRAKYHRTPEADRQHDLAAVPRLVFPPIAPGGGDAEREHAGSAAGKGAGLGSLTRVVMISVRDRAAAGARHPTRGRGHSDPYGEPRRR